jgi:spermidine synthase
MSTRRPPPLACYALFAVSGFAGLIYESIWTQYLKLFLGHAAYAQSLVLIVFMGGMAIGAGLCARISERLERPLIAYAIIEAIVGCLALSFHELYGLATGWSYEALLPVMSGEWTAVGSRLAVAAALILPQSILLGATFPLMSAGLVRGVPGRTGEHLAMLYFTNSLGAAAGVLASGFILIGWVGLTGTLRIAGILNIALAVLVWLMARRTHSRPILADGARSPGRGLLGTVALLTGLASFIYEICWIRMLSLVLGASTHSFELMLSAFIAGLALGGLCVRRLVDRVADPRQLLAWVQIAMGMLALATLLVYDRSFLLMEFLMGGLSRTDTGYVLFSLAGAFIAVLVMLPATLCAGMTLPLITGALMREGAGERAIGRVYALNTLGAIVGVLAAVHVGMPQLGLKNTLISGAWIDAALGIAILASIGRTRTALVAGAGALAVFIPALLYLQLDVNKMTAGVFRHGELASSRDAKVIYQRDGKTATVHLVRYPDALSIRTNGKSDGSVNTDGTRRGSDEITMILTGAIPLALRPDTRRAALIGIGTGLTMHTLLQSLAIEQVDTVEIEAAMVEAARGFAPRNSAAFADPRGTITIDDAKSYFSAGRRTYDLIISEPSNPWVSGVSGLFTREFYRRIRPHLNDGGLLVQWFQLYEIDASLLASVMKALGSEFPHYAVFAPSDHDLLIIASDRPVPVAASARIFDSPGMAAELWSIQMMVPGDFDARYLGSRVTLEPLFESYTTPANSDFQPVLDLRAARDRFTERSAADIVGLMNAAVPTVELLTPAFVRRAPNPLMTGSSDRAENTRLARYARDFLLDEKSSPPEAVSAQLQKDLEIVRFRLIECRAPREHDVWLHSLLRVSALINPNLQPDELHALWLRLGAGCAGGLLEFQRDWLALFRSVGQRDTAGMASLGAKLLETQTGIFSEAREFLLSAAMTGAIAGGNRAAALALWRSQQEALGARAAQPLFRLLRCHAGSGCSADFASRERR